MEGASGAKVRIVFQFSLWDSDGVDDYVDVGDEIDFQFSLWDSRRIKFWWEESKLFFQFSLWDSVSQSPRNAAPAGLLSILFVRFFQDTRQKQKQKQLSILFVRFNDEFRKFNRDKFATFNSLCEILVTEWETTLKGERALSILFVRFTLSAFQVQPTFFTTFNSLCEIPRVFLPLFN